MAREAMEVLGTVPVVETVEGVMILEAAAEVTIVEVVACKVEVVDCTVAGVEVTVEVA